MSKPTLEERIMKVDGEKLKASLIEELVVQSKVAEDVGAKWFNAYGSCLSSAVTRAEDQNYKPKDSYAKKSSR